MERFKLWQTNRRQNDLFVPLPRRTEAKALMGEAPRYGKWFFVCTSYEPTSCTYLHLRNHVRVQYGSMGFLQV